MSKLIKGLTIPSASSGIGAGDDVTFTGDNVFSKTITSTSNTALKIKTPGYSGAIIFQEGENAGTNAQLGTTFTGTGNSSGNIHMLGSKIVLSNANLDQEHFSVSNGGDIQTSKFPTCGADVSTLTNNSLVTKAYVTSLGSGLTDSQLAKLNGIEDGARANIGYERVLNQMNIGHTNDLALRGATTGFYANYGGFYNGATGAYNGIIAATLSYDGAYVATVEKGTNASNQEGCFKVYRVSDNMASSIFSETFTMGYYNGSAISSGTNAPLYRTMAPPLKLSSDGNILVFGDPTFPVAGTNYGTGSPSSQGGGKVTVIRNIHTGTKATYTFNPNTTNPVLASSPYQEFGWALDMTHDGSYICVGAPHNQISGSGIRGQVYDIDWNGSTYILSLSVDGNPPTTENYGNDAGSSNKLGYSVCVQRSSNKSSTNFVRYLGMENNYSYASQGSPNPARPYMGTAFNYRTGVIFQQVYNANTSVFDTLSAFTGSTGVSMRSNINCSHDATIISIGEPGFAYNGYMIVRRNQSPGTSTSFTNLGIIPSGGGYQAHGAANIPAQNISVSDYGTTTYAELETDGTIVTAGLSRQFSSARSPMVIAPYTTGTSTTITSDMEMIALLKTFSGSAHSYLAQTASGYATSGPGVRMVFEANPGTNISGVMDPAFFSSKVHIFTRSAGSAALVTIDSTGKLTADSYATSSDANLKRDIKDIPSCLHKISELKPKSYNKLTPKGTYRHEYGILAQDLLDSKRFQDLVSKSNDVYGVDYTSLHAINIKGMQELLERIEELEVKCFGAKKIISDDEPVGLVELAERDAEANSLTEVGEQEAEITDNVAEKQELDAEVADSALEEQDAETDNIDST